MEPLEEYTRLLTRRQLFGRAAAGIGTVALASMLNPELLAAPAASPNSGFHGALKAPHFPPKAKRVIYLFQSGAPSHIDLFDWKPKMAQYRGIDLPESVRMGQRLTGMTSGQKSFPVAPTIFQYAQHGKSGAWLSELLPHTAGAADDLCIIKTMNTEAINHDPGITFIQTGAQQMGRPS